MFLCADLVQLLGAATGLAAMEGMAYYFSTQGTCRGGSSVFAFGRGFPSKMAILESAQLRRRVCAVRAVCREP